MNVHAPRILEANRRIIEQGAVDSIADYFSESYIVVTGGIERIGHEVIRGFTNQIHKSFSDLHVAVQQGKQTGKFQAFPATGLQITWHDMVVSHFEDSLIAKEWVVTDMAEGLLRSRKSL